jgi:hypothetical protein
VLKLLCCTQALVCRTFQLLGHLLYLLELLLLKWLFMAVAVAVEVKGPLAMLALLHTHTLVV